MASYPSSIYSPRAKENKSGVVYDAAKKTVTFVEDIVNDDNEIVAIETELGLLPKGTSASVLEKIKGLRSLSDATADTIIVKGGNVGIGTTTPGAKLHVTDTATPIIFERVAAGNGANANTMLLQRDNASAVVNDKTSLTFRLKDTGGNWVNTGSFGSIITDITANVSATWLTKGALVFGTKSAGQQYETEKMRIDDQGNVGIGRTGPLAKTHIYGAGQSAATFADAGSQAASLYIQDSGAVGSSGGALVLGSEHGMQVALKSILVNGGPPAYGDLGIFTRTDNSNALHEVMRVHANGNVGIGTTEPSAKLDVNSDILRLRTAKTPASAGAAGNAGDICWDADYIYVCVATNSWKRAAIAAW